MLGNIRQPNAAARNLHQLRQQNLLRQSPRGFIGNAAQAPGPNGAHQRAMPLRHPIGRLPNAGQPPVIQRQPQQHYQPLTMRRFIHKTVHQQPQANPLRGREIGVEVINRFAHAMGVDPRPEHAAAAKIANGFTKAVQWLSLGLIQPGGLKLFSPRK